jgi:hypothetical protein
MTALKWLVGSFGGGTVMMHRLGGRHIGTARPFKTEGKGVQCELFIKRSRRK